MKILFAVIFVYLILPWLIIKWLGKRNGRRGG